MRFDCWSTTAKHSSPNAPERSVDYVGTCTNWTPPGIPAPDPWTGQRLPAPEHPTRLSTRDSRSSGASPGRALPRSHRTDRRPGDRDRQPDAATGTHSARSARLRSAHRGQDPRRDRRHPQIPITRRLRPPQRHRTTAGLVLQPDPPPTQPHRQPTTQRRAAPHRPHPGTLPPQSPSPARPPADQPAATAAWKPSACSNDTCRTSSTAPCALTRPNPSKLLLDRGPIYSPD